MDPLDSASSLRAAALLSRKRRRVDAPPPRLAPELAVQLDYGEVREEGEISDSDASPPRRSPTPPPRLRQRPFASYPQSASPLVLETSTYRLDASHVRPGLLSASSVLPQSPPAHFF
jgi:hypothetical protein